METCGRGDRERLHNVESASRPSSLPESSPNFVALDFPNRMNVEPVRSSAVFAFEAAWAVK